MGKIIKLLDKYEETQLLESQRKINRLEKKLWKTENKFTTKANIFGSNRKIAPESIVTKRSGRELERINKKYENIADKYVKLGGDFDPKKHLNFLQKKIKSQPEPISQTKTQSDSKTKTQSKLISEPQTKSKPKSQAKSNPYKQNTDQENNYNDDKRRKKPHEDLSGYINTKTKKLGY